MEDDAFEMADVDERIEEILDEALKSKDALISSPLQVGQRVKAPAAHGQYGAYAGNHHPGLAEATSKDEFYAASMESFAKTKGVEGEFHGKCSGSAMMSSFRDELTTNCTVLHF